MIMNMAMRTTTEMATWTTNTKVKCQRNLEGGASAPPSIYIPV